MSNSEQSWDWQAFYPDAMKKKKSVHPQKPDQKPPVVVAPAPEPQPTPKTVASNEKKHWWSL